MTNQAAWRVQLGQVALAAVSVVSITLLAYWHLIDGMTAITTILVVTGLAGSANALVHWRTVPPVPDMTDRHPRRRTHG